MARLIPNVSLGEIALKPERDVARALVDQLPDDCLVYHSYPWLRADRDDRGRTTLREGEADFIVVMPSHGLLVIEVKGGVVAYDAASRGWHRQLGDGSRKPIQDPIEQARRNVHYLEKQILTLGYPGRRALPFTYGYAVVFPDCEYHGPPPPGAEPVIIVTARDLRLVDRRIAGILRQWSRGSGPHRLTADDLAAVQRGISPAFQLMPVLFRQIEEQEERLVRMTEEQLRLLDFLHAHDQALIEGVAGSGKTLLARAQAQRFADAGRRTLFVCFNKALAQWLRASVPADYADRLTVQHFHWLCADWCRRAGIVFAPPAADPEAFWREQAPELLLQAIEARPKAERFAAVVVDEGQDFLPEWWVPLTAINAGEEKGALFVFYDPAQNIFQADRSALPNLGVPFQLSTNCRNTRAIAKTCGDVIGRTIATRPDAPQGQTVRYLDAQGGDDQKAAVAKILDEWIRIGGLAPSKVAVLCPFRRERSSLAGVSAIAKIPLTDDLEEWRRGDAVLVVTIRAFKGLEADAIVVMDVPVEPDPERFSPADWYVAYSRAKHLLTIIRRPDA
jgi:hypothetical protein